MYSWIGRMSLWLGDAEALERDIATHWQWVPHGGAAEVDRDVLLAGLAGLRGGRVAAANAYRAAIERWRALRLPLDEALLAIDMAYVLGPSDTLSIETAARARQFFTSLHSKPLVDLLDTAIEHGAYSSAASTASGDDRRGAGARRSAATGATRADPER